MYKITNTTKKKGHNSGPHKKGWFIGLEHNHVISPDKYALTQELTTGLLDLRQQGLISIEKLNPQDILPANIPMPKEIAPPNKNVNVTAFAEPVIDSDAIYVGKTPNYIVTAPSAATQASTEKVLTPAEKGAATRAANAAVKASALKNTTEGGTQKGTQTATT